MSEARVANSSVLVVADVLAVSRSKEREFTGGMAQTIKGAEFHQLRLQICAIITLLYFLGLLVGGYPCSKKLQKSAHLVERDCNDGSRLQNGHFVHCLFSRVFLFPF